MFVVNKGPKYPTSSEEGFLRSILETRTEMKRFGLMWLALENSVAAIDSQTGAMDK